MSLKALIGWGIFFIDLAVIIGIIGIIGFQTFSLFFIFYVLSSFIWSVIFRLTGELDEDEWQKAYENNNGKIRYFRLFYVLIIIIIGLISCIYSSDIWINAFITSGMVVSFLNYFSGETLHTLMMFQGSMNKILLVKFKRNKRL